MQRPLFAVTSRTLTAPLPVILHSHHSWLIACSVRSQKVKVTSPGPSADTSRELLLSVASKIRDAARLIRDAARLTLLLFDERSHGRIAIAGSSACPCACKCGADPQPQALHLCL
mmetsp:Transcript_25467/g.64753  ORF Transcript_25467/g.64753 Transcript_25467/m.64753 type:complete len:115 (-) Transcript_25467:694-1038(-)